MALAFVAGAVCSAIAGYMGMGIAVEANVRTATAANESLNKAFKLSFYAGSVMGLAMVGLAVLGMTVIYMLTGEAETVLGFSFGASALALLAASIPRRLTLPLTWLVRLKSVSLRMTPATPPSWRIMWVTMWAMWPAWVRTSLTPMSLRLWL
jgi:hypothetical protein